MALVAIIRLCVLTDYSPLIIILILLVIVGIAGFSVLFYDPIDTSYWSLERIVENDRRIMREHTIDLSYINVRTATSNSGTSAPFVFDNNDHQGSKLISLFRDKGHTLTEHDGVWGIKLRGGGGSNRFISTILGNPKLKVIAFTDAINDIESNNIRIASNGQNIEKLDAFGSNNTNLVVLHQ